MFRKILFSRTLCISSLNCWCHTNNSPSTSNGQGRTVCNDLEPTKDSGTVSELDRENQHLQDPTTESEKRVLKLLDSVATYSDAQNKDWATLPYPVDAPIPHSGIKEKQDPKDNAVLIFPGQGIVRAGLVRKYLCFPKAKELFECASEILKYDLLGLCLEGPQEKLNRTDYNQVATIVYSLAALEKLAEERPKVFETCQAALGYSVGELTALIFSGAISFEDGVRLVATRGSAMLHASHLVPQGMMSVTTNHSSKLQAALAQAREWANNNGVEQPVCQIAIYLYTEGRILGGHEIALKFLEVNAKQFNLFNLKRLPVSGAFHTPLMKPALNRYKEAVDDVHIEPPRIAVYSNYSGMRYNSPITIKKNLIKQVITSVKWEQCIHLAFSRPPEAGYPKIFDVGSEGRMKLILRQTNAKASQSCIAY